MLIGNPADFDRIRARYEALRYPTPAEASFNAARTSYEGLLTGSGFDTTMVPTTTPGEGVTFSVDPVTGQVTTNVPEYEVPTFETIYDAGEGLIGEGGRPIPDQVSPMMDQDLSRYQLSQNRGGGENRNRSPMTDNRNISQIEADLENARLRNALLGLVNPAFGVLGLLSTLDDQRQVDNYRQSLIDKAQSIRDNRSASDAQSGFRGDTTAPGADASTIGGTGGRRGGAGPDQGRGGFGGDNTGGRDASGIGGTGGRRGGAGPN